MPYKRSFAALSAEALESACMLSPQRVVRPGSAPSLRMPPRTATTLEVIRSMVTEDEPKRIRLDDDDVDVPRVVRVSVKSLWADLEPPVVNTPVFREDFSSQAALAAQILFWDFLVNDWMMTLDAVERP